MTFRSNPALCVLLLFLLGGCNPQKEKHLLFWDHKGALPREKGAWLFVQDSTGGVARVQDGLWETWYSNGHQRSSVNFTHGRITGTSRFWHANGRLAQSIPYDKNGLPHGIVRWWDSKGDLLTNAQLTHGTGTNYVFDGEGHLRAVVPFVHGEPSVGVGTGIRN